MKTKLICIPYAGATGMVYLKWKKYLSDNYDLIPVDLPGRGRRISESFLESIEKVVEDIIFQLEKIMDERFVYALYGHSMGCLIIYELIHTLRWKNYPMPVHIFLSGRNPPHYGVDRIISDMDDMDFFEEISRYGGTPVEFFQHKELLDIFLPILKSDYKLVEKYVFHPRQEKIPGNMTFFYSTEDEGVAQYKIKEWQQYIAGDLTIHEFEGGHFFIHNHYPKMLALMMEDLNRYEQLRKKILQLLKIGKLKLFDIAAELRMAESSLLPQINILKYKDLILEEEHHLYSLNTSVFDEAAIWLSKLRSSRQ
jgi:Predicted thioesterase involved in non-ribosomal peptide biosynthesis